MVLEKCFPRPANMDSGLQWIAMLREICPRVNAWAYVLRQIVRKVQISNFLFVQTLKFRKKFGHVRFGIMGAEMAEISVKSCFPNFWCQIQILVKFHVSNCFSWEVTIKTPKADVKWGSHWKIQKILKNPKDRF